ncbi:MAG: hypothetical protein QM756_20325 [Polyangiaceae bacterium]
MRRLDWENMGFNYVLVFSPNTLADAPHNLAATIDVPAGASKAGLLRKLAQAFPSTSVIETGGILREARALLVADVDRDPRRRFGRGAGRASPCCSARSPRRAPAGPTTTSSCACWARAGGNCCCCRWPNTGCWLPRSRWSRWCSAVRSAGR